MSLNTVWCAVRAARIGHFSETINLHRCIAHFDRFLLSDQLREKRFLFQQYSLIAHTLNYSMHCLESLFGDRIIGKGFWPACSPVLNPCDFPSWSTLKR
jgi:hypothetical protein